MYPDKIDQMQTNGKVKSVEISPFELYRRNHGMVTKYSKKNKGPVIKQLKYYDKKIGSHIDITPDSAKGKHVILQLLKPWRTDVYYNSETEEYEIMGIKYSDLKFNKSEGYGIKKKKYLEIKNREQVSENSEFMFTLYRRDRILVRNTDNDDQIELLFWSRSTSNKLYAEMRPLYRVDNNEILPIFGKGRLIKRLVPNNCKIWKVNTNILGDPYYLEKESKNPKNILD